jgi:hypothetical protein
VLQEDGAPEQYGGIHKHLTAKFGLLQAVSSFAYPVHPE